MIAWSWSATAPAASGCGVHGDRVRALEVAAGWMREHGATSAQAGEVRVCFDAISPGYLPAGPVLEARLDGRGRVRWAPARARQAP